VFPTITHHVGRHAVGYLALFVALGGTSYAATAAPGGPPVGGAPAGGGGGANVGARARTTGPVQAKHGTSTEVALSGGSWTQNAGELELLAGTMVVTMPGNCTGGFGNALALSVDGQPVTFAPALSAPGAGSTTVTIPFAVGTLAEPGKDTPHTLTAKFTNTCSKDGEDFTVRAVQVDILKFR
jgi:hypothetical protein